MSKDDLELARLRAIETKACALRDRLRANHSLSDPAILDHADELSREARVAVEAHIAACGPSDPST
jgi:hypothetical protein